MTLYHPVRIRAGLRPDVASSENRSANLAGSTLPSKGVYWEPLREPRGIPSPAVRPISFSAHHEIEGASIEFAEPICASPTRSSAPAGQAQSFHEMQSGRPGSVHAPVLQLRMPYSNRSALWLQAVDTLYRRHPLLRPATLY